MSNPNQGQPPPFTTLQQPPNPYNSINNHSFNFDDIPNPLTFDFNNDPGLLYFEQNPTHFRGHDGVIYEQQPNGQPAIPLQTPIPPNAPTFPIPPIVPSTPIVPVAPMSASLTGLGAGEAQIRPLQHAAPASSNGAVQGNGAQQQQPAMPPPPSARPPVPGPPKAPKTTANAAARRADSAPATTSTKKGRTPNADNYGDEEDECMLNGIEMLIENGKMGGQLSWETINKFVFKAGKGTFPARTPEGYKGRFKRLWGKKKPTGQPEMRPAYRRAQELYQRMKNQTKTKEIDDSSRPRNKGSSGGGGRATEEDEGKGVGSESEHLDSGLIDVDGDGDDDDIDDNASDSLYGEGRDAIPPPQAAIIAAAAAEAAAGHGRRKVTARYGTPAPKTKRESATPGPDALRAAQGPKELLASIAGALDPKAADARQQRSLDARMEGMQMRFLADDLRTARDENRRLADKLELANEKVATWREKYESVKIERDTLIAEKRQVETTNEIFAMFKREGRGYGYAPSPRRGYDSYTPRHRRSPSRDLRTPHSRYKDDRHDSRSARDRYGESSRSSHSGRHRDARSRSPPRTQGSSSSRTSRRRSRSPASSPLKSRYPAMDKADATF